MTDIRIKEVIEISFDESASLEICNTKRGRFPTNQSLITFTGIMIGTDSVTQSTLADQTEYPQILDLESGGEWLALSSDGAGNYEIHTDPSGFSRIYYARIDEGGINLLIVGPTFQSVAARLRDLSIESDVNWPMVMSHLFIDHTLFKSITSEDTYSNRIKALMPNKYFVFNKDKLEIVSENFFRDPKERSYECLLKDGISRATAQIRSMANLDIETKQINLSGGRDSRLVLALLLASGQHQDFSVTSIDPARWGNPSAVAGLETDLNIAGSLASYFDMRWTGAKNFSSTPIGPSEMIAAWGANWSNRKWPIPSEIHQTYPASLEMALRGGGGELLRTTDLASRSQSLGAKLSRSDDPRKQFGSLVDRWLLPVPDSLKSDVSAYVTDSLFDDSTRNLGDMFNNHYAMNRNRDHFGHLVPSMMQNELAWHPLSQPEFRYAAQLLPPRERDMDFLPIDIFNSTSPELSHFRYDSNPWSKESMSHAQPVTPAFHKRMDRAEADLVTYRNIAEKTFGQRSSAIRDSRYHIHLSVEYLNAYFKNAIKSKINSIYDKYPDIKNTELHFVLSSSKFHSVTNLPNYIRLVSHLESIVNVFSDLPQASVRRLNLTSRRFLRGASQSAGTSSSLHIATSSTSGFDDNHSNVFNVEYKWKDNTLEVTVDPSVKTNIAYQYAFYLYSDDLKIDQRWYSESSSHRFSKLPDGSIFKIKAFIKQRPEDEFPIIETVQNILKERLL